MSASGCGTRAASLVVPYEIYDMSDAYGVSVSPAAVGGDASYFSEGLCVSEDISLGTDTTDSQVAEGAGAFNLATGSVLYAKNLYERLYPASTTKILTAYIALTHCDDLDAFVTVSHSAVDLEPDSSVCGLKEGDVIRLRDLLYGMILRSGNDAANAVAEYVSGDTASFAQLMNETAWSIGATHSHFVNPHGMPDADHYTTVYDMYLIFAKALENEQFASLIATTSYDVAYTDRSGKLVKQTWPNTCQYMSGRASAPDGITVVGGKTGTTGDAGYCLALYSLNTKGEPVISIVFKADARSNLYLLMNEILQQYGG